MKKVEMVEYLETKQILVNDLKFHDIQKLYWKTFKEEKEKELNDKEDIVFDGDINKTLHDVMVDNKDINIDLSIREKLEIMIVEYMEKMKGKVRGTDEEIGIMFNLYNNYYKRAERPTCSTCVGNVYQKLMRIYEKNK